MENVTSVFVANNQLRLALELIVSASQQRKDRVYRSKLEAVVDPTNKRLWHEIIKEANYWGVEIHD